MYKNKRGNQIVEAALVLPLIILIIISLLTIGIYSFEKTYRRCSLHTSLIEECNTSNYKFKLIKQRKENMNKIQGTLNKIIKYENVDYYYVIDEGLFVRLNDGFTKK